MPYNSEFSEFSRVNLVNMESLKMTSINAISSRKAISGCQEDSTQFTVQQMSVPYLLSDGPEEASGRPLVLEECPNTLADTNHRELMFALMSGQPSGQQLPIALVCTGVRTANWRLRIVNIASNRPDARAMPSGLDD